VGQRLLLRFRMLQLRAQLLGFLLLLLDRIKMKKNGGISESGK
jgi:hypothetical protein